jgi:hypothetical protein
MAPAKRRTSRLVLHASTPVQFSTEPAFNASERTVVEQLAKWTALLCPSCLCSIYCIEGLVKEQANCPGQVNPWRTVLIKCRVVVDECYDVNNDEAETAQGDLAGNLAASSVNSLTTGTDSVGPMRRVSKVGDGDKQFLRHGHWKELDCDIGIEWLQDVFGDGGVVNTCIFVFVQLG